jgi:Cu/Ag efflux protein CusF
MKTIKLVNRNQVIKLIHSGRRGPAGTITVGSVTTGTPSQAVTITNVGTPSEAILNFVIPQGIQGDPATNIVKSVNDKIGEVVIDKTDVGLANVDNTSDADKPISNATQNALNTKQPNGDYATNTSVSLKADKTYVDSQDALKADKTYVDSQDTSVASTAQSNLTAHTSNTANPHSVTKSQVGLSNVPNLDTTAAVANQHTHANKAVLDTTTASFTTADEAKLGGIATGAQVNTVTSVNTRTGAVTGLAEASDLTAHTSNTSNPHSVTKAQVGLGNANDTSDMDKPISTAAQTALNLKANLASPALTGTPTAPTQTANNNSTRLATTAYVDAADLAHVQATDPHPQYHNDDRGDARYAGQPYAVMAKAKFASLASSYGMLGKIFGNSGYANDLQVYGESTQASIPTPDVPVPIVSSTGSQTVRSDSKNLILVTATSTVKDGLTFTVNTDKSITVVGTATGNSNFPLTNSMSLPANTTFTLSGVTNGGGTTYLFEIQVNINATITYQQNFTTPKTFTTVEATTNAQPRFTYKTGTVINLTFYPQLEFGSSATAYQVNTNSTQTLPLATTQLRSLPNGVSDRIYKDGSTWKLEQNVGREFLDGSETWVLDTGFDANYSRFVRFSSTPHLSSTGMNNRLTNRGSTGFGAYEHLYNQPAATSMFIQVLTSRLTANTVAAFKTWLATNNVESLYDLPTPVTTTITDPTLITALENIRTYQGVTNITAGTPVSGSYGLDLTASLAGKVDTTGNQTVAGVKTFSSSPIVPTATTTTQAVNKAQMDTADALKVTGTGRLYIQTTAPSSPLAGDLWMDIS